MKTATFVASALAGVSAVNAFGTVPETIQKYATNYLAPIVDSNKAYLDSVCGDAQMFSAGDDCNPVVAKMKGEGYSSFGTTAKVNNGQGLDDARFDSFIEMISGDLNLDKKAMKQWRKAAGGILEADDEPVTFRTVGCNKKNKCKFLTVIGNHDAETKKSDISIVNVDMTFEFAPDIFVVRKTVTDEKTGKSTTMDVVEERASTQKADVDQLIKFMEIIAFEKLLDSFEGGSPFFLNLKEEYDDAELDAMPVLNQTEFMDKWGSYIMEMKPAEERTMDEEMRLQSGFLPFLTGLAGAVNSVTSAWSGIVSAFSSSYEKTLVDMKTNRGFDKFRSSMKTFSGEGLPHSKSKEFLTDLGGRLDIPKAYKSDFKFMAKWIQFFDSQTWTQSDVNFSKGKGGTTNNFNFFAQNIPEKAKMNIVYVTCKQDFKLAPDLYVWMTRKSKLGGLFSSAKTEIKKKPAAITEEQLKFVSEWFLLLAYQELSRFMNIACPGNCKNPVPP